MHYTNVYNNNNNNLFITISPIYLSNLLASHHGQVDFVAGQITFTAGVRVLASHPLTKSLTETSKKLLRAGKM